jgi:hypothetical protein
MMYDNLVLTDAPPCDQKINLLKVYINAVRNQSSIVRQLSAALGEDIFRQISAQADAAIVECQRAKTEFDEHCKKHGC